MCNRSPPGVCPYNWCEGWSIMFAQRLIHAQNPHWNQNQLKLVPAMFVKLGQGLSQLQPASTSSTVSSNQFARWTLRFFQQDRPSPPQGSTLTTSWTQVGSQNKLSTHKLAYQPTYQPTSSTPLRSTHPSRSGPRQPRAPGPARLQTVKVFPVDAIRFSWSLDRTDRSSRESKHPRRDINKYDIKHILNTKFLLWLYNDLHAYCTLTFETTPILTPIYLNLMQK